MGRQLLGVPRIRTQATRTGARKPFTLDAGSGEEAEEEEGGGTTTVVEVQSWVDKIKESIPIEVVTAWVAIESFIGETSPPDPVYYLPLVGLVAVGTVVYMWVNVETPTTELAEELGVPFDYLRDSQRAQIALGTGAFLVWAFYLGGVYGRSFADLYNATAAQIVMVLYVFLGPQLVPRVIRKLHGVELPDSQAGQGAGSSSGG